MGLVLVGCPLLARSGEAVPVVWAHQPYVVRMAVTNRTAGARTVAKVTTSCACLTAKRCDGGHAGRVTLPGMEIPFELTLNPAGMEGLVTKAASVTFDDGTVEAMKIRVNVRTRVKLEPGDAAFGVVVSFDRKIEARLVGEAVTNGGAKIVSVVPPENPQFDVRVADDGLGVVVGSRAPRDRRPAGVLVETWNVTTTDAEIPKISFVVSAQVADGLSVTPGVLAIGGVGPQSQVVSLRRDDRLAFKVISAETMPRKWGDVRVEARPLNGWRITVENIDPNEVRQFSKKPFLKIMTNVSGMESVEIPLRIEQERGAR